jgi:hypothetical protein
MAAKRTKDKSSKGKKPAKQTNKEKRPKLVRDSFTMPENDYSKIKSLKLRCLQMGLEMKKSELLRAGLLALETLDDTELRVTLDTIEKIKTGRPPK